MGMKDEKQLKKLLDKIDGKGYGAYKKLKGKYKIGDFELFIEHVQGDPYASPSRFSIKLDQDKAKFPEELFKNEIRKVALEDYITRKFSSAVKRVAKGHRGSGKSGLISVVNYGQAVLKRTSCRINEDYVKMVFNVGLPAKGRTVMSRTQAKEIIFDEITEIAEESLLYDNLSKSEAIEHVGVVEDSEYIRNKLEERDLVAFVAENSILPRESGIGDRPMDESKAVPFETPESLEVEFDTPNHGKIKGMGIPEGITLIVGGGYHGKSTLLNALSHGVYNHIPGDGREYVVSKYESSIIRAEDTRFVENVDISPFISDVPSDIDTRHFSSEDASGSTSQASNIMESLESGSKLLFIDEDTSATNFMIRDERMQELVAKEKEPITPLIDKIKLLYEKKEISTILVMGGSGDYFDVADTVIMMDEYVPRDVTDGAKQIAEKHEMRRKMEGGENFGEIKDRFPNPETIDPHKKSGKVKIRSRGKDQIQFGYKDIDLNKVRQITESPQVRAIGDIIYYAAKNIFDGNTSIKDALDEIEDILHDKGLVEFSPYNSGKYTVPRRFEIAAALNRLRSLKCKIGD